MKPPESGKTRKLKSFLKRKSLSLKTVVAFCFLAIWILFFIGMVPEQANWEVGTVATRDLQADRSVTYEDKTATEERQRNALKGFVDVYKLSLERFNKLTLIAIDNGFTDLEQVVTNGAVADARPGDNKPTLSEKEKVEYLKKEYQFKLSEEQWKEFLTYSAADIDLLHRQAVAMVSDVMGVGVKEDEVTKARSLIFSNIDGSSAFSLLDKKIVKQLLQTITFYPTSVYDQAATEQKKEEILRTIEPVWHTVQKGQRIVSRGDIIDTAQYDAMQALGLTTDLSVPLIGIGVFVIVLVFFLALHMYLCRFYDDKVARERDFKLMLLILLVNVSLAALVFSIRIGDTTMVIKQVGYLTPIAAGAMLTAVLIGTREAIFMLLLSTLMIGLYAQDSAFMMATMLGGVAAISQTRRLSRRLDLGRAAFYIAVVMGVSVAGYGLVSGFPMKIILLGIFYSVVNGFLSVVLTIGLLPYFEVGFNITTSMSLLELGDPSNRLLRRLMNEAPGTYHHSVMVANLAEAAATAIGANPLLVRIGAYYHDVGKLRRPIFFAENQFNNEQPHAKISPLLSTLIITAHVKDGVAMAREAHLPDAVIDLIAQHHGNTVVRYFYAEAHKNGEEVHEDDFRYHQKKPQTREAAVLMMADSVEAAVRSARGNLTAGQMEGFIRKIIKGKQTDGQFEECDLTFKDLNDIAEVFNRVLSGLYHKRIEYPSTEQLKSNVQKDRTDGEEVSEG